MKKSTLVILLFLALFLLLFFLLRKPGQLLPEAPEQLIAGSGEKPVPELIESIPGELPGEHFVFIGDKNITPKELTIKAGETVIWKNVRSGTAQSYAYIFGTIGECRKPVLESDYPPGFAAGEEFRFTFMKPQECTYLESIRKYSGKIIVAE